jgi:acetolactate synthase-1/2/3 large subunit
MGDGLGVRQYGFQATPITSIAKEITKYAVTVMRPEDVLLELEKALSIARQGRPGPVLVDLPDDIQRTEVPVSAFRHYTDGALHDEMAEADLADACEGIWEELRGARRPILAFGWGVRLAEARDRAVALLERLNVPCVATWGAMDAVGGHPLCLGSFGTHGLRAANFAVQRSDYILAIGTRLDTKATGSPASSFAPGAKLTMVDIDGAELAKMSTLGRPLHRLIQADAWSFLGHMRSHAHALDCEEWLERCRGWQKRFPALLPEYRAERGVNPYVFMEALGAQLKPDDIVVSDTGCCLAWAMQGLKFSGQRFVHALNQTPMGYGLPAAIGAAFSSPHKRVILLTGDGGLMVNVGELVTLARHKLNIYTFLFNNQGHAMCRQTQRQWLGGRYAATDAQSLSFPEDWRDLARSCGIHAGGDLYNRAMRTGLCDRNEDIARDVAYHLKARGPQFLEITTGYDQGVVPQVRFGKSIEDADPALPEAELAEIMRS